MRILCFDIAYVGFSNKNNWKKIIKKGENHKIEAIKSLRFEHNKFYPDVNDPRRIALKEAKDKVDAYIVRHNIH